MDTLGHVIMCLLSRFLLSHKIHLFHWFIGWRFCICTWPIRSSLFRYFEPPRFSFYSLWSLWFYDCMMSTHSWVHWSSLISLCSSTFSLMHLYIDVHVCVCRHFHEVPLCSRHDLITLRFHYPGPLLPSSLASQDYIVWYLGCVAAQPFLNVCMVSLITSDLSFYAPFLSIRVSLILWNTWSILYRLYSNLIMSLLGCSYGAKLVMT